MKKLLFCLVIFFITPIAAVIVKIDISYLRKDSVEPWHHSIYINTKKNISELVEKIKEYIDRDDTIRTCVDGNFKNDLLNPNIQRKTLSEMELKHFSSVLINKKTN